jgi:signal transduction histidine kinase
MRLALVSALLTFVILCVFAIVIGSLTISRVREDFNHRVVSDAERLANGVTWKLSPQGHLDLVPLDGLVKISETSAIRIFALSGSLVGEYPSQVPSLGPLHVLSRDETVTQQAGDFVVVETRVPLVNQNHEQVGQLYLQYGRRTDSLNATVGRIELFLVLGVLGGTALALLAGIAIARRAMAPIASLTGAAAEIARTRDPSTRLPASAAEDEVAELSRTLQSMLHELDTARGESEASLARQRRFVADASHELRTPLTSVLANLEILAESLHGEQAEAAYSALRSSQRMRRLVSDLLLLARSETTRETATEPCRLDEIAVEAVAELEPVADGHAIAVHLTPATVRGSHDDLHRLALNLIGNAVTHTPPGTSIDVTVRPAGDAVELLVADDGPGVPEEVAEHLFERFVSGQGDRGGSTGLGLAIVRAVAEAHGGSVELVRDGGPGANFCVRLPAASDLDDDRQDHRPPAQAVVDQLGQRVV